MSQRASNPAPRASAQIEEELLRLLWELPRMWRAAFDRRLKPLGLSEAKWRTVLVLSHGAPNISQIELANLLGIEAPSLARLLDRLAADGWIERRSAAHDRRVKTIHLLPKASSVIKKIDAVISIVRREALREISVSEMAACSKTLRKMRRHFEADIVSTTAAEKKAAAEK
jgi:MarR family transcriptional regulator, transcriptional regulator for hemolysin